jgi:hypothetical protein
VVSDVGFPFARNEDAGYGLVLRPSTYSEWPRAAPFAWKEPSRPAHRLVRPVRPRRDSLADCPFCLRAAARSRAIWRLAVLPFLVKGTNGEGKLWSTAENSSGPSYLAPARKTTRAGWIERTRVRWLRWSMSASRMAGLVGDVR